MMRFSETMSVHSPNAENLKEKCAYLTRKFVFIRFSNINLNKKK